MGKSNKNSKRNKAKDPKPDVPIAASSPPSGIPNDKKVTSSNKKEEVNNKVRIHSNLELLSILSKIDTICDNQDGWMNSPCNQLEMLQSLIELLSKLQESCLNDLNKGNSEENDGEDKEKGNINKTSKQSNQSTNEEWDNFWKWVDENSSSKESMRSTVELGWMGDGFGNGCTANRDIAENEVIMSIPTDLMLCCKTGHAIKKNNNNKISLPDFVAKNALLSDSATMGLTLLVANEKMKGKDSFFHAYLSLLPTTFDVPMYWKYDDLAVISQSNPEVFRKCCNGWRMACKHYGYIMSLVHNGELSHIFHIPGLIMTSPNACANDDSGNSDDKPTALSFDLFKWALSVTVTRQNEIPIINKEDGNTNALALIPLWDMCNHSSNKLASTQSFVQTQQDGQFNQDQTGDDEGGGGGGALECTTHVKYNKGDEIHIFYGKRPNSEYFLYSGFIPSDNQEFNKYSNYITWALSSNNDFNSSSSSSSSSNNNHKEQDNDDDDDDKKVSLLKSRVLLCHQLKLKMTKSGDKNVLDKDATWNLYTSLSNYLINDEITIQQIKNDFKLLFLSSISSDLSTTTNTTAAADDDEDDEDDDSGSSRLKDIDYKNMLLALMASTCSKKDANKWLKAIEQKNATNDTSAATTITDTNDDITKEKEDNKDEEKNLQVYFTYCMNILLKAYENQLKLFKMTHKIIDLKKMKLLKELKTLNDSAASASAASGGASGSASAASASAASGGGVRSSSKKQNGENSSSSLNEIEVTNKEFQTRLRHLSIAKDLIGSDVYLIEKAIQKANEFLQ